MQLTSPVSPKVIHLPYVGRMGLPALILALLVVFPSALSFAAKQTSEPRLPDVLVVVDATRPGQSVSFTYPRIVRREIAQGDLAKLLKETGWSAINIKITDEGGSQAGVSPSTTVEFLVQQAVNPSGFLPIEPMVKAFRSLQYIQVLYWLPANYRFTGPGDFQNRYVSIKLNARESVLTYDIRVLDSGFSSLGIPTVQNTSAVPHPQPRPAGPGWGVVLAVIVLALVIGVLVYIITDNLVKRGRQGR